MKQTRLTKLIVVAIVLAAAIVPGAVAAQTDSDDEDGLLGDLVGKMQSVAENPTDAARAAVGYAKGLYANAAYRNPFRDAKRTPEQSATDVQTEFNEHNETYLTYINERVTASSDRNVIELKFTLESDGGDSTETRYRYLVADVNETSGDYENATIVSTEPDREVDHTVELSGLATEELPDDLVTFREEYAAENETPPGSYSRELASKYAGHVHGTFEFLPDMEG